MIYLEELPQYENLPEHTHEAVEAARELLAHAKNYEFMRDSTGTSDCEGALANLLCAEVAIRRLVDYGVC